jgi:NAD-dependent deacetylase
MTSPNPKLVFLTGAGISAESGIQTFRGGDGLWENHRIEDVATPSAWRRDPNLVLRFYNERRKNVIAAQPNLAHQTIVDLESDFDVHVVTQNIDDLHERAGAKKVLHLHGEILKARSTCDQSLVYPLEHWAIKIGDVCEKGSQLRPHIVWFGEAVPAMDEAIEIVASAEIVAVVGTSMTVYPAAGLVDFAPPNCRIFFVDPADLTGRIRSRVDKHFQCGATVGLPALAELLRKSTNENST